MTKGLDKEFADSGGFSIYPKGGLFFWSLRVPGLNTVYQSTARSLLTLLDEAEADLVSGAAVQSVLKREREDRFQKKRKDA